MRPIGPVGAQRRRCGGLACVGLRVGQRRGATRVCRRDDSLAGRLTVVGRPGGRSVGDFGWGAVSGMGSQNQRLSRTEASRIMMLGVIMLFITHRSTL